MNDVCGLWVVVCECGFGVVVGYCVVNVLL